MSLGNVPQSFRPGRRACAAALVTVCGWTALGSTPGVLHAASPSSLPLTLTPGRMSPRPVELRVHPLSLHRWTRRLADALSAELGRPVSEAQVRAAWVRLMEEDAANDPQASLAPVVLVAHAAGLDPRTVIRGWADQGTLDGYLTRAGHPVPEVLARLADVAQAAASEYARGVFEMPLGPVDRPTEPVSVRFARALGATLGAPSVTPEQVHAALRHVYMGLARQGGAQGTGRFPNGAKPHPATVMTMAAPVGTGPTAALGPGGKDAHILPLVALDLGLTPGELASRLTPGATLANVAGARTQEAERLLASELQGLAEIRVVRLLGAYRQAQGTQGAGQAADR